MNKLKLNYKKEKIVLLFVIILLFIVCFYIYSLNRLPTKSLYTYENKSYGFQITLPASWNPVKTIITEVKIGGFEYDDRGLSLGYLTSDGSEAVYFYNIYAIPTAFWSRIDRDVLFELGRNSKYVFALSPKNNLMATNQNEKQGMCEDKASLLKEKELCAAYSLLKNNVETKSFKVFNFKAFDPQIPDKDWKKLRNEKYGFEISYPSDYKIIEDKTGWPKSVLLLAKEYGQSYGLIVELWNSEAEANEGTKQRYPGTIVYKQLENGKVISLFNNNDEEEVGNIIFTFKILP